MNIKKTMGTIIASAVMVVGLTACGTTASPSTSGTKQDKANSSEQKQANKGLLTQYELNLQTAIRLAYTPFSTLAGMEKADTVDSNALKATVQEAEKANTDLKSRLAKINIPSQLPKADQTKLKASLTDLQTSFDKMSTQVKSVENVKTVTDLTAAMSKVGDAGTPAFTTFMNKANAVNKKIGILATDYTQEIK